MEVRELLNVLHIAERLKDELRHCETSKGRRESVAEHSWRLALMAFFMKDEFPTLNMDKVIKMCLIHDLGECFTGDIPTFMKSASDEKIIVTLCTGSLRFLTGLRRFRSLMIRNWLRSIPR